MYNEKKSTIDPVHMQLIIERIKEGRCIPLLGAGVNVNCNGKYRYNKGLPLGAEVASKLVEKIQFKGRDPENLARVALEYEFRTDRSFLIKSLKTILRHDEDCETPPSPSPLLKTIAKLPFKLIITTNYDRLFELALVETKKDFTIIIQNTLGFENNPSMIQKLTDLSRYEGCILYKIHGTFNGMSKLDFNHIGDIDESMIIITEDDYIKFLTIMDKETERIGVPRQISSKLTYSTLLFLGYSLEDWDFRIIYKGLIETLPKQQARKSFAIQKNPSKFWVEFWRSKGVEIYDIDLYDFAEELESSWKKLG